MEKEEEIENILHKRIEVDVKKIKKVIIWVDYLGDLKLLQNLHLLPS